MDESLDTRPGLKKRGFTECYSVKNPLGIWDAHKPPLGKGIYLVIWNRKNRPEFRDQGTWKGFKRLHVSTDVLKAKWVKNALIIYVGANEEDKKGNLKDRIEQLIDFGSGNGTTHRGGRYMWQIKNAKDLKICWKTVADDKQEDEKKKMLAEFKRTHGKLPFANLKG